MEKFNVAILAGEEKGPLYDAYGCSIKAMLPIHGKPMLGWVIDAFSQSQYIDNIVVVGPEELDNLQCMKKVRKRIFEGLHVMQNLTHAVAYLKTRVYSGKDSHRGYLISFCDAVFLDAAVVDATLERINSSTADIILHYVEKQSFSPKQWPTQRTYIPVGGRHYTGTTLYYVKKFGPVLRKMDELVKLRTHRKDPQKIFEVLQCKEENLEGIAAGLSKKLGLKVEIVVSPHPEMGVDVDKPVDYELARRKLPHDN